MNPGKVSNSILKRSVLKQIKKRQEYAAKPAIGVDCAYISLQKKDKPAVVSAAAAATGDIAAKNPVQRAANNIYAGGGIPVAAECTVLLPLSAEEAKLLIELLHADPSMVVRSALVLAVFTVVVRCLRHTH